MGIVTEQMERLPYGGTVSWRSVLEAERAAEPQRFAALDEAVTAAYAAGPCNPAPEHLFRAFALCPFEAARVVLLGQDPYPDPKAAMGLAFSVTPGTRLPQSLKNIAAELKTDVGFCPEEFNGDLSGWAEQGVLLLNTTLTVEAGNSNSHRALWGDFTLRCLRRLYTEQSGPLAFLLWGGDAKKVGRALEKLPRPEAPRFFFYGTHPSPLSAYRGFFGSRPFSQINAFLFGCGAAEVDWCRTARLAEQ